MIVVLFSMVVDDGIYVMLFTDWRPAFRFRYFPEKINFSTPVQNNKALYLIPNIVSMIIHFCFRFSELQQFWAFLYTFCHGIDWNILLNPYQDIDFYCVTRNTVHDFQKINVVFEFQMCCFNCNYYYSCRWMNSFNFNVTKENL